MLVEARVQNDEHCLQSDGPPGAEGPDDPVVKRFGVWGQLGQRDDGFEIVEPLVTRDERRTGIEPRSRDIGDEQAVIAIL